MINCDGEIIVFSDEIMVSEDSAEVAYPNLLATKGFVVVLGDSVEDARWGNQLFRYYTLKICIGNRSIVDWEDSRNMWKLKQIKKLLPTVDTTLYYYFYGETRRHEV